MGFSAMLTRSVPEPWKTLLAIDDFNKARHDYSIFTVSGYPERINQLANCAPK
jgi:hypothetical protein